MKQIVDKAYQGLVNKASPTGLLPIWNKQVDNQIVQKYGFSYNARRPRRSSPQPATRTPTTTGTSRTRTGRRST